MDTLILEYYGLLALISYGIGYYHCNTVERSIVRPLDEWFYDAVGEVAKFGLLILDKLEKKGEELEEENMLKCSADIDGQKVSVIITKIVKQ